MPLSATFAAAPIELVPHLGKVLASDSPTAQRNVAAVEAAWFSIDEVGGGIAAARQANTEAAAPGGLSFWQQPVFLVTAALMPLVYFVTWQVLSDPRF